MTVTSEIKKIIANGDDSGTTFSFSPMVIFDATQLTVTLVESDGTQTDLTLNVDYSVDIADADYPDTGSITYPLSGDPLASEESLILKRVVPVTQLTDLENQGGYFPDTQENALDKLTMIDLQQDEIIERCLRLVPTVLDTVSVELPEPEAGKFLGWNSDGTAIVNLESTGEQGEQGIQGPAGAGTGDMLKTENLSGLANNTTARSNLGVYSTSEVDTAVAAAKVPVGTVLMWCTASPPSNYIFCDGSAISRVTYATLYAVLSTTYGVGDGVTTFNVPDFAGRMPIGKGTGDTAEGGGTGTARALADEGGAETHTLTTNEMPLHGHPYRASYSSQSTARSATTGGMEMWTSAVSTQSAFTGTPSNNQGQQIGGSGGGAAHAIMPPFLGIGFIIKYQ